MLKHLEDDGDLSLVIADDGVLFIACSQKHYWTLQGQPLRTTDAALRASVGESLLKRTELMRQLDLDEDTLQLLR